MKKSEETCWKY